MTVYLDGRPVSIDFMPVSAYVGSKTGRGSIFVTSDEKMQEAIESSKLFGRRIRLMKSEEIAEKNELEEEKKEEKQYKIVKVSCPSDAKDYLMDEYNIERKNVSTIKKIKECAEALGIMFDGI